MATNCFATPTTLTLYVMRPILVCANWVSAYRLMSFVIQRCMIDNFKPLTLNREFNLTC
jgi:hypothetical protein